MIGGTQDRIFDLLNDEINFLIEKEMIKELKPNYIELKDIEIDTYEFQSGLLYFSLELLNTDLGIRFYVEVQYNLKDNTYKLKVIE